jgi:hypothetical protein
MVKPSGRTRPATPVTIVGRIEAAEQFLADAGRAETSRSKVTLLVHAGIAASDAICGKHLGRYSLGDNHEQAVALLAQGAGDIEAVAAVSTPGGALPAGPYSDSARGWRLEAGAESTAATRRA